MPTLVVRLADEELATAKTAAKKAGSSLSTYVRALLAQSWPERIALIEEAAINKDEEIARLKRRLAAVGEPAKAQVAEPAISPEFVTQLVERERAVAAQKRRDHALRNFGHKAKP